MDDDDAACAELRQSDSRTMLERLTGGAQLHLLDQYWRPDRGRSLYRLLRNAEHCSISWDHSVASKARVTLWDLSKHLHDPGCKATSTTAATT